MNEVSTMLEQAIGQGLEPHPDTVLIIQFSFDGGHWELDSSGKVVAIFPTYITGEDNFKGFHIDFTKLSVGEGISVFAVLGGEAIKIHNRIVESVSLDSGEVIS